MAIHLLVRASDGGGGRSGSRPIPMGRPAGARMGPGPSRGRRLPHAAWRALGSGPLLVGPEAGISPRARRSGGVGGRAAERGPCRTRSNAAGTRCSDLRALRPGREPVVDAVDRVSPSGGATSRGWPGRDDDTSGAGRRGSGQRSRVHSDPPSSTPRTSRLSGEGGSTGRGRPRCCGAAGADRRPATLEVGEPSPRRSPHLALILEAPASGLRPPLARAVAADERNRGPPLGGASPRRAAGGR